jgi:hypothetical protein
VTFDFVEFVGTREVFTTQTFTIVSAKHSTFKTFTILLKTLTFLAITARGMSLFIIDFGLKCLCIPLFGDNYSFLSFFLVAGTVVTLHTIAIITIAQGSKALTIQLQTFGFFAIAVAATSICTNRGDARRL